MYPIFIDLARLKIALTGNGKEALRRLGQLDAFGARHVTVYADAPSEALRFAAGERLRERLPNSREIIRANLLMIAGLEKERAYPLAELARAARILVNVEDDKPYCDFYFGSIVKRGDLCIAASTGGRSPALAQAVRHKLEQTFGPEWESVLDEVAVAREQWRAGGDDMQAVAEKSHALIEELDGVR